MTTNIPIMKQKLTLTVLGVLSIFIFYGMQCIFFRPGFGAHFPFMIFGSIEIGQEIATIGTNGLNLTLSMAEAKHLSSSNLLIPDFNITLEELINGDTLAVFVTLEMINEPLSDQDVFFLETSGHEYLNPRQICSIEAASHIYQDLHVHLFMISPVLKLTPAVAVLLTLNNVKIYHLDLGQYFYRTPLEEWYNAETWKSSHWPVSHMSDALRFITLFKFGGIYMDLDAIALKALRCKNCIGRESENWVAAGVMKFEYGHQFISDCIIELKDNFRGDIWGYNGPQLATRVLEKWCGRDKIIGKYEGFVCKGIEILPISAFYAVPWIDWKLFFIEEKSEEIVKKLIESSYVMHVWNRFSAKTPVHLSSKEPYAIIASNHCSMVVNASHPLL